jgi:SAM-dependent methyltransferase
MAEAETYAPDYAERNRAAWNEAAPIHQVQRKVNLEEAVPRPDFSTLDAIERGLLMRIGVEGKQVAQLCCNNGRELISVMRLGATAGVGFDISDAFVAEAQRLAALAGTNCRFVRTNVYDIDAAYAGQFDLVYITIGALCWFDDLPRFFRKVAELLRPGGKLLVYEVHPILDLFALPGEEEYDAANDLKLTYSYFRRDPFVSTTGLDYWGHTQYAAKPTYSFPHAVSTVINSALQGGLLLEEFLEYPHDISNGFAHLEHYGLLPMCYTLVARKPETP